MAERRRLRASWGMLLWLAVVWVLLWGDLSLANVLGGIAVALAVTTLTPLPRTPFDGRFRPWGVVRLLVRFARDVVVASGQVAWRAITGRPLRGAVIRVRLRSHSDVYLSLTAGMTSLVPGSIVIEAHRFTGTLYVHVFDIDMEGGLDVAHRSVLAQEERVLRAFASDVELREAGYRPGSSPSAGRLEPSTEQSTESDYAKRADVELDQREGDSR